jgi:signal transduction histidine kinase
MAGFYFIQMAQSRIEKDILGPLLNKLLSEDNLEIRELGDLRDRVRQARELEAQQAVTLAIEENNEQVAHDIRSPISAINELLSRTHIADAELKNALSKAVARANSIANHLLTGDRMPERSSGEFVFDFSAMIQDIAAEKKPLFVDGEINIVAPKHLYAASPLSSSSLARVLSNIIDNAMLACDQKKCVEVSILRNEASVSIQVLDAGKGIPDEIIGRLGQKGVSHRESSQPKGSGRGVYSAKKILGDVGGGLDFETSTEIGTKVTITIPTASVKSAEQPDFVLVDNEEMIRVSWQLSAKSHGKVCRAFSSMEDFLKSAHMISKTTPVFLDSDLGGGQKGQDYAPLLREMGFQKIILATAYEKLHGSSLPFIDRVVSKRYQFNEHSLGEPAS